MSRWPLIRRSSFLQANCFLQANRGLRQSGMGMVEVLIASTLGLFILLGVVQGLSMVQENGKAIRSLGAIQEAGRNSLRFLEQDIQLAAYQGCASGKTAGFNAVGDGAPTENLFDTAVQGFVVAPTQWVSGNTNVPIPAGAENAVPNSDAITLMHASPRGISLAKRMTTRNEPLVLSSNTLGVAQGDLVLVSDCFSADLFRVTNSPVENGDGEFSVEHDATQNNSGDLSKPYLLGAQVSRLIVNTYFVGETNRVDLQGNRVTALYRQSMGAAPVELVEGVETFKVLYGERLADGNIRYVDAENNIDWANVVSVRASLLINGDDRVLSADDVGLYQLAGTMIGPGDNLGDEAQYPTNRKLRRAFNATMFIRNRI